MTYPKPDGKYEEVSLHHPLHLWPMNIVSYPDYTAAAEDAFHVTADVRQYLSVIINCKTLFSLAISVVPNHALTCSSVPKVPRKPSMSSLKEEEGADRTATEYLPWDLVSEILDSQQIRLLRSQRQPFTKLEHRIVERKFHTLRKVGSHNGIICFLGYDSSMSTVNAVNMGGPARSVRAGGVIRAGPG
ncbi:hypothetical protein PanWU01x14_266970 [Parasponia andersonii]|uniref:Uncharacterized protein n=1 Tax=Parasponia andersonii TaxID=3476 RepID=A0A2P5B6P3_PARAD|nr:hypothetical protein PanWU01x14_266970 [Parasponia andersonii]